MITKQQFTTLNDLFDYYNNELFDNDLGSCLVNMSRHRGAHGFFAPKRWTNNEEKVVHEISLNPDTMNRADIDWHSTLVHEMVHLWQQLTGNTSRRGYHCKKFADKMDSIGLIASSTGRPGGKRTGQNMTHYIQEGGLFEKAFKKISSNSLEQLKLPYTPSDPKLEPKDIKSTSIGSNSISSSIGNESENEPKKSTSGVKIKYECNCVNRIWGKSGLKITCNDCETEFKEC